MMKIEEAIEYIEEMVLTAKDSSDMYEKYYDEAAEMAISALQAKDSTNKGDYKMDLTNKPDLLERFEKLRESKDSVTNVELTKSEINFIYVWMKTAWAYEDALDEALGLTRGNRG